MSIRSNTGFTIIELMIAVAIIGIVATLAIPSFSQMIQRNRIASLNNEVVGMLNFARSEALRRGRAITIDDDGAGNLVVLDGVELLRQLEEPGGNVVLTINTVTYRSNGMQNGGPTLLRLCGATALGREITVTVGGLVRSQEVTTC